MSEIKKHCAVHAPEPFPVTGRLPANEEAVWRNERFQSLECEIYRQELNAQQGLRGGATCAQSLHVSLYFDGTNNNEPYDTKIATPPHPSNIARLFHAGLRGHENGYFSYYIPGVGTPFPDINELDFSTRGLATAHRGEDRINWALIMIVWALNFAFTKQPLDTAITGGKLKSMSTTWPLTELGRQSRRRAIMSLLEPLRLRGNKVLPKVLKIKLFVYGFSRGAAEARTFVTWLTELFDTPEGCELPEQTLIGIPISIEFLGLLDTVASVGVARASPFADGHMDWADGTQPLPDAKRFPGFIKDCRHFVAAHEQRLCFPLDSIRYADGTYPPYATEVIYPGMHSDVGGGYPMGDQGKARGGDGELLSQVVLHDLYAAAFAAGAPLMVPEAVLPEELKHIPLLRVMNPRAEKEFGFNQIIVNRFNAWRTTLGLTDGNEPDQPPSSGPISLNKPLEDVMADQLAWITGWRIERFARGSYVNQPFYNLATQTNATNQAIQKTKRKADTKQIELNRHNSKKGNNTPTSDIGVAGLPEYEPVIDQQQLREAAIEFEHDYQGWSRSHTSAAGWALDGLMRDTIYLLNDDDEKAEYIRIKAEGEARAKQMFTEIPMKPGHYRVSDAAHQADIVALFDDHIHDSRAWFLYDATSSRELWGDYFRYRMVFFGDHSNKPLTPVVVAGRVVGIALAIGGAYSIRKHGVQGVSALFGAGALGYQVINRVTGQPEPFLPNAMDLLKPTLAIGAVVAQQRKDGAKAEDALRMKLMMDYLGRTGGLVDTVVEKVGAVLP